MCVCVPLCEPSGLSCVYGLGFNEQGASLTPSCRSYDEVIAWLENPGHAPLIDSAVSMR